MTSKELEITRERRFLMWKAVKSRLLVISLQAVSNWIIPDHNADAFKYPRVPDEKSLDAYIQTIFGGFERWDAQYFMHISIHGYTYENTIAFFPLLPYLVRWLRLLVSPILLPLMNVYSLTLLIFVVLNFFIFILATIALYDLTCYLTDRYFAKNCASAFCYNPASVFFSAPYTECMFAYLTFKSILHSCKIRCIEGDINYKEVGNAMWFITLSMCTRSNGILNLGFVAYFYVVAAFESGNWWMIIKRVPILVPIVSCCALPTVALQFHYTQLFCTDNDYYKMAPEVVHFGRINNYVLVGEHSRHNQTWCLETLPRPYSYVQNEYWNVGLFRYYEFKQIPNFLLAAPICYLVISGVILFFVAHWRHYKIKHVYELLMHNVRKNGGANENSTFVLMLHCTALTMFSVLFAHIQVITRMLCSATPIVYWLAMERKWTKYYFYAYFVIGTVMFSNFLPWT